MLEPSFLPNHQTLSLSFPLLLTWPWPGQKKRESRRDRGVCVCVCAMRCVGGGACSADPSSFPPSPLPACAPPPTPRSPPRFPLALTPSCPQCEEAEHYRLALHTSRRAVMVLVRMLGEVYRYVHSLISVYTFFAP